MRAATPLGLAVVADSRRGGGPVADPRRLTLDGRHIVVSACDLPWLDAGTVKR